MPHLASLTWDEDDRLRVDRPAGRRCRHPADGLLRLRRRRAAGPQGDRPAGTGGQAGSRKSERIYLGADRDLPRVRRRRDHHHARARDAAGRRRRQPVAAGRDPHGRHRQGAGAAGALPARQPPGLGGARARRPRRASSPTRSTSRSALPPTRPSPARPTCRSATGTPARSATRRTTCTTTAPAITRRGSAAGRRAIRPGSPMASVSTRSARTTRSG